MSDQVASFNRFCSDSEKTCMNLERSATWCDVRDCLHTNRLSLLLARKSDFLASVSLLLASKCDFLVSISLLLASKSDLLVSISLLLVGKSDLLVSISLW